MYEQVTPNHLFRTFCSVTFISDLERGKPTAEIEKTIRLINILGMDLLVEKEDNMMRRLSVFEELMRL